MVNLKVSVSRFIQTREKPTGGLACLLLALHYQMILKFYCTKKSNHRQNPRTPNVLLAESLCYSRHSALFSFAVKTASRLLTVLYILVSYCLALAPGSCYLLGSVCRTYHRACICLLSLKQSASTYFLGRLSPF